MGFPDFYVVNRLRSWGWPRQKGFLRKVTVVDASTLDQAIEEAIQVAMGVGAGREELAMAMLAELADQSAAAGVEGAVREFLRQADQKIALFGQRIPWRSLMALRPDESSPLVPLGEPRPGAEHVLWEEVGREPLASAIPAWCGEGIAWALHHRREVDEAFETARAEGLAATPPYTVPTQDELYNWCDDWVRDYEEQAGPLPYHSGR